MWFNPSLRTTAVPALGIFAVRRWVIRDSAQRPDFASRKSSSAEPCWYVCSEVSRAPRAASRPGSRKFWSLLAGIRSRVRSVLCHQDVIAHGSKHDLFNEHSRCIKKLDVWTFRFHCCAVSKHKTLQAFQQGRPSLGPATFVAPSASLIGKVKLGRGSSVWYNAVLRGRSTSFSHNSPHTLFASYTPPQKVDRCRLMKYKSLQVMSMR